MKNFKRDINYQVIYSIENRSKMNIFEFYKYYPYRIFDTFMAVVEDFKTIIKILPSLIINLIGAILFPLALLIVAYENIRSAKRSVKAQKEINRYIKK